MTDNIKKGGYYDTPLWGKIKNENGEDVKVMIMPITRYANVLGRPIVETNAMNLGSPEFAFLKTAKIEVSDDCIFSRANQSW